MRPSGDGEPMGSLLIYPGCKVIIVAMIIRIKMVGDVDQVLSFPDLPV